MAKTSRIVALIVAAGKGERAGGDVPKQYAQVAGKSVLAHAIDGLAHPAVDQVLVVIGAGQEDLYRDAIGGRTLAPPVLGGTTRHESVRNGLAALAGEAPDVVLIHDAARPFLPAEVIERLLTALTEAEGAVPVLPMVDSLALGDAARHAVLGDPVDRSCIVRVQTPQAFNFKAICAAHDAWAEDRKATDDAQVARAAGMTVVTVTGDARLEKLTLSGDLFAAGARGRAADRPLVSRTGLGFDVHAFGPGDAITLGGLRIPHDKGLVGHSDADVALHALTDALLGAVAAGDIGSHFPPSDDRWRGAESRIFVEHARALAIAGGGRIDHVDVTIICERPKIGPYRDAIRASIAAMLQVREGQVSIKATTTERLGFTGRGEGIAAQAVATIRVPEVE